MARAPPFGEHRILCEEEQRILPRGKSVQKGLRDRQADLQNEGRTPEAQSRAPGDRAAHRDPDTGSWMRQGTPAVSVGNVGQLAIDLIISTLNMPKVGYFYTDCLVPMVGNNPYATAEENSTELSTNAEVYSLSSRKLVALQLRSIFIKYKSSAFCEKLLSWVKSSSFGKVIVLSSSHSYQRTDPQLRSTPFRYLITPCVQKSVQNKIKSLNWQEMEKTPCIPEMSDSDYCVRIPGGGITRTLYTESCSKGIQMVVLLKFVSEGDNIPDALGLVEYLNEWLQIIKRQSDDPAPSPLLWKIPSSWKFLFGSGLPPALF